ncbi:uncharacterized protein LOC124941097 [Impatiens glandulifera]|uniref:uncharacterized protein LOC124941097 n=1 Tax=Impatiens glandulifera TaxID=253017 RepID=UPI001FB16824|nr:uncharacterized protein LOC124941097 [Impatiens glandulifera]
MAKRSQKRIPHYDKGQTGCIWTFISIFDFRNGRSTRRLLSDTKRHHSGRQQQQHVGNGYFKSKLDMLTNSIDIQPIRRGEEMEVMGVKMSVKELMEKEMFSEEYQNKLMNSDKRNGRIHHKRSKTTTWSSFTSKSSNYRDEKVSKGSVDLDAVINDICNQIHQERFINDLDTNSSNLDEAIKTFVTDEITRGNPIRKKRSQSLEEILLKEDEKRTPVTTQFSFTEIKRRLKHAVTKDNLNYNEKYAIPSKSDDENEKLKEERIKDIYVKARKHLSEIILRNGDESEHCSSSRRSLGKVLFETDEKKKSLSTFDDLIDSVSSEQNSENYKDDMEIVITADEEECKGLDSSKTPCILEDDFESCCHTGSLKVEEEDELLPSPLSSSSPVNKNSEYAKTSNDRSSERPSPVSVLESIFGEDETSPASTRIIESSGESSFHPRQIQFEEGEICIRTNQDNEESSFEYVEAVLLASDLKWDDYLLRWISSVPILDPSLFHEVELFSSRSFHDQKLLFDCTNEVLKEVCSRYFSYYPRVSFITRNIRQVPIGQDLIDEIWEGVERNLVQLSPCVLQNMMERDMMEKVDPNNWMNLRFETEGIGAEIGETIMDELLEDLTRTLNENTIV